MPSYSGVWNLTAVYQAVGSGNWTNPPTPIGLFGGGTTGSSSNVIDYLYLVSAGNATDFGDLTVAGSWLAACSSSTRGCWGGGGGRSNVIDYVTIATIGNATDFGDLTVGTSFVSACSSATRRVFGGGASRGNVMDYITIATSGNATDFGDLNSDPEVFGTGACSSPTRGLFAGGYRSGFSSGNANAISYITIATTGNASSFGDLTVARFYLAGASSSTRGVFAGGYANSQPTPYNVIDYVTIASTGNATDFGDTTVKGYGVGGCAGQTLAAYSGFMTTYGSDTPVNVIDSITIASTGNATDFGDLSVTRGALAGCSNAHGGL